tara:strand:+ start:771 stop:1442 length:672 start_codon:yes stop_codon:yes gene_type:complete
MKGQNKLFTDIGGIPTMAWPLKALSSNKSIAAIQPVISKPISEIFNMLLDTMQSDKLLPPVYGGSTRSSSTFNALKATEHLGFEWALVHDAARPFLNDEMISAGLESAKLTGASIAAMPTTDSIKLCHMDGTLQLNLDRNRTWMAQTPQIASFSLLLKAHKFHANELDKFTDESAILHSYGAKVQIFEGSPWNIKLTTEADLVLARHFADSGLVTPQHSGKHG